jgi:transposase
MRTHGSAKELEARRRIAGRMLLQAKGVREVARLTGLSPTTVSRCKRTVEKKGLDGLAAKPHPGKPCRLSSKQKQRLVRMLAKGAKAAGFDTDLWTCPRVSEVIERTFGVSYHPDHVWKLLRNLGYSPQKPQRRAREQNPEAVRRFRKEDWPRLKKRPSTAVARRFSG